MKCAIYLLLGNLTTFNALAICEEERERADRANRLTNTLSEASALSAVAGSIIGGYLFGPLGGLAGTIGLVPGAGAMRAAYLKNEKEEILRRCLSAYAALQERKREEEREQQIELCAQNAGCFLGALVMEMTADRKARAVKELDEYINQLVESDADLADPNIKSAVKAEEKRINAKYF